MANTLYLIGMLVNLTVNEFNSTIVIIFVAQVFKLRDERTFFEVTNNNLRLPWRNINALSRLKLLLYLIYEKSVTVFIVVFVDAISVV